MRNLMLLAAAAALLAGPVVAADAAKGEWTGFITDTHCGAKGASKDHGAGCVEKCVKGGSKAQIANEADGKMYDLDDFGKVKAHMGGKVTVKGTLDAKTNTITVESAAKAEEGK